jgi:hypothetical protein
LRFLSFLACVADSTSRAYATTEVRGHTSGHRGLAKHTLCHGHGHIALHTRVVAARANFMPALTLQKLFLGFTFVSRRPHTHLSPLLPPPMARASLPTTTAAAALASSYHMANILLRLLSVRRGRDADHTCVVCARWAFVWAQTLPLTPPHHPPASAQQSGTVIVGVKRTPPGLSSSTNRSHHAAVYLRKVSGM